MSDPTYHKGPRNYGTGYDMMARIDELEAACWRMQEERDRAIAWRDSDKDRADRAEVSLEKAVDALQAFNSFDDLPTEAKRPDIFEIKVRLPILRTLAELTGGKR